MSTLPAMPNLLLVTVPTDEVLNKEGKVRFPGTDAAVAALTEAGWTVEVIDPLWPGPLRRVEEGGVDAVLVSCFKAVPRSRVSVKPDRLVCNSVCPPSATTLPSASAKVSAMVCASRARNAGSPSSMKICEIALPVRCSMTASMSGRASIEHGSAGCAVF